MHGTMNIKFIKLVCFDSFHFIPYLYYVGVILILIFTPFLCA
jgi:hypothetical protein